MTEIVRSQQKYSVASRRNLKSQREIPMATTILSSQEELSVVTSKCSEVATETFCSDTKCPDVATTDFDHESNSVVATRTLRRDEQEL